MRLPAAPSPLTTIAAPPLPPERERTTSLRATMPPWGWKIVQERPSNCLRFTLGRRESVEMEDGSLAETTFRQLKVTVEEDNPETNKMAAYAASTMTWPEVKATVTADLTITGTASTFEFDLKVEVIEGDEPIAAKSWQESIPRNLV